MKNVSISEVTRARLERLTSAQQYAIDKCNDSVNECFTDIAVNIQVYPASHIRCAQKNLTHDEETPRRALSALVWLSKAAGFSEGCSSDARRYARDLSNNKLPLSDAEISAMGALAIFEARAYEVAVSLQCDIEK